MAKKKIELVKKHLMIRYCFNCRNPLDYHWYLHTKNYDFPNNDVKKAIWENKMFQILCCDCYNQFFDGTLIITNPKLKPFFVKHKLIKELTLKDQLRKIDPSNYRLVDQFIYLRKGKNYKYHLEVYHG